ncbi:hypothetical protein NPIL_622731 [Nephila pilipes]|uniref:Uncharacterized protein n=1 Tax=Nephila pilipes TaxID=299642 RepID=A0A8X6TYY0_NEPPI|nr:hypothetical protein NPIL_622731 [Nephila pilipes]
MSDVWYDSDTPSRLKSFERNPATIIQSSVYNRIHIRHLSLGDPDFGIEANCPLIHISMKDLMGLWLSPALIKD